MTEAPSLTIDLSDLPKITNKVYLSLYRDEHRYLALMGGAGSGKSVFAAQKIIYRMLTGPPKQKILVIRKVASTIKHSVYPLFKDTITKFGATSLAEYWQQSITFKHNESSIIFMGIDDPEKLKSIQGITSVWIEEATELDAQDLLQIDLRIRGKHKAYKQIILTYNPIDSCHWLKGRFHDQVDDDAKVLVTTYKDNQFLDEAYISKLEGLITKDLQYYNIYALGQWGSLTGQILTRWKVEEIAYTVENLAPHVYYGIDFGYNDPTVVLTVGCKDQTVYIMDEIYITGATNNDLIHLMKQSIPRGALLVCDSSEPARITELSRSDWSAISAIKGKDSVMAGLDWLRTQQIVVSPRCTNTIKELGSYRYRQGKDGALLDEPLGFNDHCIDALRYSIESYRQASSATNITPDMIGRRRRYAE